jgi:hypothetical protein
MAVEALAGKWFPGPQEIMERLKKRQSEAQDDRSWENKQRRSQRTGGPNLTNYNS